MTDDAKQEARIFPVDNRFHRMAQRPGGVPREQAVAAAQAQVDVLKPTFTVWLDQGLQELGAALTRLEENPADQALLALARRNCSQLRDVGTTFGYELVTFIAENLGEILDALKAGANYDKQVIDCHVDAFLLAKSDEYRHRRLEQVTEMANGLRRIVERVSISPSADNKSQGDV
jgi:chemotaxis protein histidine kinase CheA